nr:hypothetical protein [Nocardia cyriacigeorgica]
MTVLSSPHAPRIGRSGVLIMVLAVGLSAFGVGCSDGAEPSSDAEGTEPLGIGREVTVPIAAAVATVESPGDEPRAALRAGFPDGTVQEVTLRTDHRIQQQINDQPPRDFSHPALTIPLTARTHDSDVDLTLGAVTTPDPALSQALTAADGSHAGLDMSELGAITALRLAPSPDTSNSARAAIEQAFYQAVYQSITFPDDPVGVGAVWTVRQEVTGGVALEVTTATLTARDGNRLTIDLTVAQTPKSRTWNLPNDAGTLQIEDYAMTGAGTIIVDLGLPLPVSGAIDIGGHQSYRDARTDTLLRQTISTRVSWGE